MTTPEVKSVDVTLSPMGPHGHASRATFDNYADAFDHFVSLGVNSGLDKIEFRTDSKSLLDLTAGGPGFDYRLQLTVTYQ